MRRIDPARDMRAVLRKVERPGRYVGGEFGSHAPEPGRGTLSVVVSYPDLYEIGMSNSAIKILYALLNSIEGVSCERVFAPAPDFEAELRAGGIPLYSLETGTPLSDFDVIGFSMGYELTMTNMLAILELGGLRPLRRERGPDAPIVIAGGPAATNPAPLGPFVDCVFIGEAEGWIERTFGELARMKTQGAGRQDLLARLRGEGPIWHTGKTEPVVRSVWRGFESSVAQAAFPMPSIRVVQDHGTVEVMRGCPHACRFCHASCFYRPLRIKSPEVIRKEVSVLVDRAGYRQVTLSSLSSGDYPDIHGLVRDLNTVYSPLRVSFSLPSLHIDSLALRLLGEISEVRKSGITFAVETAKPEWQAALGKIAPLDKTIEILREARSFGWKAAKFYFMVGLPPSFAEDESGPIVDFLRAVRRATGMSLNVNIACFIPKPHTPFERAAQLGEEEALRRIMLVKQATRGDGFKIGYHAPLLSLLEGIMSRGDERAGLLALEAYKRGARLDGWEEHIKTDIWREAIAQAGWDPVGETCRQREPGEPLPWDGISLSAASPPPGAGPGAASMPAGSAPLPPAEPASAAKPAVAPAPATGLKAAAAPAPWTRVLFSFSKKGPAAYVSHLDLMNVFERALARAGLRARFTEGFNPKPRLEFASPLGVGIESDEEIAAVDLEEPYSDAFAARLSAALPPGLAVLRSAVVRQKAGERRRSLMSLYWGSEYLLASDPGPIGTPGKDGAEVSRDEAGWRVRLPGSSSPSRTLPATCLEQGFRRTRTFAAGADARHASYFEDSPAASSALS